MGMVPVAAGMNNYDDKIEAEDFEKLGEIVIDKIRSVKGVIDTKTLTGARF